MQRFPQKLRDARADAGMSQAALAEAADLSVRSVSSYETGASTPRPFTLRKLAKVLNVTVEYLSNDEVDDPQAGIVREHSMEYIRSLYGNRGVLEADALLQQNRALFAGGSLSQEAKDAFFQAIMTAYVTCKEEAKETFGRRDKGGE
ncbi:MAG: helix-turn-helix transcriptional regulator [Firmicutes bacterium]|nr:helix-turn-helix transcriptional regulator [Bacillota bacterium]